MKDAEGHLSATCQHGPVVTVKSGSVSIPIYLQRTHTGPVYLWSWRSGGKRFRASSKDLDTAKRKARAQAEALARDGGDGVIVLSGEEKRAYMAARRSIAGSGLTLEQVARDHMALRSKAGSEPLESIVNGWLRAQGPTPKPVSIADAVDRFVTAKESAGRSKRHVKDLRNRMDALKRSIVGDLSTLNAEAIRLWIGSMKVGARTRNNYLTAAGSFIRWCERNGLGRRGWAGLDAIERASEPSVDVAILKPEELRRLLTTARPEMVPFIALGAFAGIRHAEIARMRWGQIKWEQGHVEVMAAQAKNFGKLRGRARRLIPLLPALRSWIEPLKGKDDAPICPLLHTSKHLRKATRDAGLEWSTNALRHSFGSYRIAEVKNEAQVALEMGNTPAMVFAHYRAVVTEEAAREWFGVRR